VYRIPWDHAPDISGFDGIVYSNGPGDPKMCKKTIDYAKNLLSEDIPVFGICLGSQILALAAGANTYKLKYGHRSHNQPVIMSGTSRCYITSQNHGYAVETSSLQASWKSWFENLNDKTCEGIIHETKPIFAVQFHPEASAGPVDTEFLFDYFMEKVTQYKERKSASNSLVR
jgi:carbamoyl-phosphate synthase small subunit